MEERLRLAYLAAMGIPVWVPRGAGESAGTESVQGTSLPLTVPATAVRNPRTGAAREMMAKSAVATGRINQPSRVAAAGTGTGTGTESLRFVMATCPGLMCVDASETAVAPARLADLIGGIGFALGGTRQAPVLENFAWPLQGVSCSEDELREATLGKLRKLREGGNFDCLLLMGRRAASVVLGWSDKEFASRIAPVSRPEIFPGFVLATLSCQELLLEPLQKATLWRELQSSGAVKSRSP